MQIEISICSGGNVVDLSIGNSTSDGQTINVFPNTGDLSDTIDEFRYRASLFVSATLPSLNAQSLHDLSDMALSVAGLSSTTLLYSVEKLVSRRSHAMQEIWNQYGISDVDIYRAELASKVASLANLQQELTHLEAAVPDMNVERQKLAQMNPSANKLMLLNAELAAHGYSPVSNENREYYCPSLTGFTGLIKAAALYVTRGPQYRDVRKALKSLSHDRDGNDLIAETSLLAQKYEQLADKRLHHAAEIKRVKNEIHDLSQTVDGLQAYAHVALSDDQILEKLHQKVVGFLFNPAFREVVGGFYAEDFPQVLHQLGRLLPGYNIEEQTSGNISQAAEPKRAMAVTTETPTEKFSLFCRSPSSSKEWRHVQGIVDDVRKLARKNGISTGQSFMVDDFQVSILKDGWRIQIDKAGETYLDFEDYSDGWGYCIDSCQYDPRLFVQWKRAVRLVTGIAGMKKLPRKCVSLNY